MRLIRLAMMLGTVSCGRPEPQDSPTTADSGGTPEDSGIGGIDTSSDPTDTGSGGGGDTAQADTGSGTGGDTSGTDTGGTDTGEGGESPLAMTDFLLEDLNPTSARYGDSISPRDYLSEVSGWYFIKGS